GKTETGNTKPQKKELKKGRKAKLDDTTITFPQWIIDILSRRGIHQSNMELPPLSDESGCNRLETWLHALFYYIDATSPDEQTRHFMQDRVLAIPKTMPSTESLTPPFLGKTKRSDSDTNTISPPSAQGKPSSSPDFDFNDPHPVPPTSDVPIPPPIPASHPHDTGPGYPKAGHTKEKTI
ncbi:hypothetical protein H0H93_015781, partial [Arthromyces matolae]